MTSAPALIEQLTASGLSIKVVGPNEVEIEGPEAALGRLPVEDIKRHKPEIIKALTCASATTPKPPAPSIDEVAERIGAWLNVTDNPPHPCSQAWRDLADKTSDFALSVWAFPAVMTGWSDSALFAVDEGLIPEKLRRGFHLLNIDSNVATLMTGKGELENFRRPRTAASPWWRDPRVAVADNTSAHAARKGN